MRFVLEQVMLARNFLLRISRRLVKKLEMDPVPSKVKVNKTRKNVPLEELKAMSKEDLVEMVTKLEAHNFQLKNLLDKKNNPVKTICGRKKTDRKIDFSKFHKRHILLKFLYLGWDYEGYVTQENTVETIEYYLFEALKKVCLIETRQTSNYNRCGRTDNGVSAFEQTVSLDVRSQVKPEEQFSKAGVESEIDYCFLLNKVLPREIRAVAWQPLFTQSYSARFDCYARTYKYFFPRGELDVEKMQEAANMLIGLHDFRNFCKMDVANGVVEYYRKLNKVDINLALKNHEGLKQYDMLYLEIQGSAFLWHMIRCIIGVLMLVGAKRESPDIIVQMLDVEVNNCKPQYTMASELPLNLFHCYYKEDKLEGDNVPMNVELLNVWIYKEEALSRVIVDMQEHWCRETVRSTMIYEMLKVLRHEYSEQFPDKPEINKQVASLNGDIRSRDYKKLFERQKCPALEDRIDYFTKKRKIVKVEKSGSASE